MTYTSRRPADSFHDIAEGSRLARQRATNPLDWLCAGFTELAARTFAKIDQRPCRNCAQQGFTMAKE